MDEIFAYSLTDDDSEGLRVGSGAAVKLPEDFASRVLFTPAVEMSSQAPAQLVFTEDSTVPRARGGQARLSKVKDGAGNVYALKTYADQESARAEWAALHEYRLFKLLPEAYWFGTAKNEAYPGVEACAIVEEWIEGDTLSALVARGRRLCVEEALAIISPVVDFAAFCASEARIALAHRDIKPANIIVQNAGGDLRVRLVDLGLATMDGASGRGYGTRGFAPPELYLEGVDEGSADVYSIAATLLAMLSGTGLAPAYGVVLADSNDLAYDGAYAGACAGDFIREQDLNGFVHEQALQAVLLTRICQQIEEIYAQPFDEARASACLEGSLAIMDKKLKARIARCLAMDPAKRPTPDMLKATLPLNREAYESELEVMAENIFLGGSLEIAADTTPEADMRADMTFEQAYDYYNRGLYGKCIPAFERLARQGNHSAKYNLAVMIRDGLGGLDARYTLETCAQFMADAAEAGNLLAQKAFGEMLFDGRGIKQNKLRGVEWIKASAETTGEKQGFKYAKVWLDAHAAQIAEL